MAASAAGELPRIVGMEAATPGCRDASGRRRSRRRPLLDDLAEIHHDHLVGDLRDHPEVVGDEEHRHAVCALQVLEQVQDPGLGGDVERGRRLVGDEQAPGRRTSAIAIITRWHMPPDSWNG